MLGKTEKYWEGISKEKKKTLENKSKEKKKLLENNKYSKSSQKNISSIINTTTYNSDLFNDDSFKDSLISNEETKLNNFIKIIENKLGKFYINNYFPLKIE